MVSDKWGIPFFYPSKKTLGLTTTTPGFFWEQNNDIFVDNNAGMVRLGKERDSCKVIDKSTGEWEFPFNFGDGLSLSGPTGHHSGGETHGCEGFTYMINVSLSDTPAVFRFRKETFHVNYDNHPEGTWTHPLVPYKIVGSGWNGFGWVRYNKKDGAVGTGANCRDSVICEAWWNPHPEVDITDWTMLRRVEDKGPVTKWGDGGAGCDGDEHQAGVWSNIQFRFKNDASDFSLHPVHPEFEDGSNIHSIGGADMSFKDCVARGYGYKSDEPRDIEMKCLFKMDDTSGKTRFKNISLREIDPTLSFDDTPAPPPTDQPPEPTTVQGNFKLQWDINTIRGSSCQGTGVGSGGGGETGNTKFYTVYTDDGTDNDKELSDTSTFDNRTRVVMSPANTSSIFKGKIPTQLDIPLKKVGSPTGNILAKIYNSSGTTVYQSPTTLDSSTLTTSYVKKIFDFSTNTHAMVTGDRIGIAYTSSSSSNYVVFSYGGTSYPNTNYYQFEGGTTWDQKTRRLTMDVWE